MTRRPKHRILVSIGTRPEAVKLAPVVQALRKCSIVVAICRYLDGSHTGLSDSWTGRSARMQSTLMVVKQQSWLGSGSVRVMTELRKR